MSGGHDMTPQTAHRAQKLNETSAGGHNKTPRRFSEPECIHRLPNFGVIPTKASKLIPGMGRERTVT